MIRKVTFVPQYVAQSIIPDTNVAMISICTPEDRHNVKLSTKWERTNKLLELDFHDIDREHPDYVVFSKEHAKAVIDFIECLSDESFEDNEVDTIIVHCLAGVSRSAAVALFIHENFTNTGYRMIGADSHNHLVRRRLEAELYFRTNGEYPDYNEDC